MPSIDEELAKAREELDAAMAKPFSMRLTRNAETFNDMVWLMGMCETGTLRVGGMIRVAGGSKPDVITHAVGLMLASGPKNELFPWFQEVAIIVKGVTPDQFEKGMIVTRVDEPPVAS